MPEAGSYHIIVNRWSYLTEGQLYPDYVTAEKWRNRLPKPNDWTVIQILIPVQVYTHEDAA